MWEGGWECVRQTWWASVTSWGLDGKTDRDGIGSAQMSQIVGDDESSEEDSLLRGTFASESVISGSALLDLGRTRLR